MKHLLFRLSSLIFISIFLTGCSIPLIGSKKMAALNVTSNPKASVFLDGSFIGSTPFSGEKLKPGEYSIKIAPENGVGTPWEARIKLSPGILTVVSRELGDTPDKSSGYVLSLEPSESKDKTSLLAVSTPDGSVITVDGEPRGFAPKAIENISPGEHTILVSSPGYIEKSLKAQVIGGFKLTASIQLAKLIAVDTSVNLDQEASKEGEDQEDSKDKVLDADLEDDEEVKPKSTPSPTPKPTTKASPKPSPTASAKPKEKVGADLKPPYVTVLDTPTGWLNVRESASTTSEVIKKVYPGDSFKYLKSTDNGWHQIELDDGQEGWVSGKYVKLTKASTNTVDDENQ